MGKMRPQLETQQICNTVGCLALVKSAKSLARLTLLYHWFLIGRGKLPPDWRAATFIFPAGGKRDPANGTQDGLLPVDAGVAGRGREAARVWHHVRFLSPFHVLIVLTNPRQSSPLWQLWKDFMLSEGESHDFLGMNEMVRKGNICATQDMIACTSNNTVH